MEKASISLIIATLVLCLRMCTGTDVPSVPDAPSTETTITTESTATTDPTDPSNDGGTVLPEDEFD